MACHSIAEVKDVRGNGGYVIEESKQYPFAFTDNKMLKEVNKLLIRMEPSLHRQTFMKPFMRTPEFCSTCHKVGLLPPLNEYHWMRGQNHYDGWYDSGVSGNAVRSFYDPPKAKACRDCHLPLMPSEEFGNQAGMLHDHLFRREHGPAGGPQRQTDDRGHSEEDSPRIALDRHVRHETGPRRGSVRTFPARASPRRDCRRRGRRQDAHARSSVHERHGG